MGAVLNAEEAFARSLADRADAASVDAEARWPHNESAQCDRRIELRLLDAMIGPDEATAWQRVRAGEVWILWPATGAEVPAPPGADVAALARDLVPDHGQCDRCTVSGPIYGGLLCAMGARIIGLSVCGTCAYDLTTAGYQPLWTFRPGHHDKEIHDAD